MIPHTPWIRAARRLPVRVVLTTVVLLAPLKLGTVAITGEVGLFPLNVWEWLFATWPPFLAPVLAGFALLLAVILFPPPRAPGRFWLVPGVWLCLSLTTLAGLVRTTEWDAASLLFWHFLGVGAFALAVFWVWLRDPGLKPWLIGAVVAGTLLSALAGWNQVKGGGFTETIELVQRTVAETGQAPAPELLNRLYQTRAFGTFVYPNSFAAHLILTAPLVLYALWQAGAWFRPQRLSRTLFLAAGTMVLGGALWFSGSRAAVVALGGGITLAVLCLPLGWRRRWLLLGAGGLLVAVSLWVVNEGRALDSLGARLGYYRAAVQMFDAQPLTGVGLGEFFPEYMRLKAPGAEETRLPHNMFLGLAAQCGIGGALAALACLVLPLALGWLAPAVPGSAGMADRLFLGCVQAGLAAWSLHALADFNSEIPGTVMIVAILPLLVLAPGAGVGTPVGAAPPGGAVTGREGGAMIGRAGCAVRLGALLLALSAMAAIGRVPGELAYRELTELATTRGASLDVLHAAAVRAGQWLPWSPYPWSFLGRCADEAGAGGLALACYGEASVRTPHRSGFQARLAASALAAGDLARAREALARAMTWYPHSPEVQELARKMGPPPPP